MTSLPPEILAECIRQQKLMGWPDRVPAYAEIEQSAGNPLWKGWENLTVGDCEQLVEQHTRAARKALERWMLTRSTRSLRAAGYSIIRARLYRCQYFVLMGMENTTEADMPFPISATDPDERIS